MKTNTTIWGNKKAMRHRWKWGSKQDRMKTKTHWKWTEPKQNYGAIWKYQIGTVTETKIKKIKCFYPTKIVVWKRTGWWKFRTHVDSHSQIHECTVKIKIRKPLMSYQKPRLSVTRILYEILKHIRFEQVQCHIFWNPPKYIKHIS